MSEPSKKQLANVVLPQLPLKQLTYKIPPVLQPVIEIGHRVLVSVGKRKEAGFVTSFPRSSAVDKLKFIEDLMDPEPLLPADLIQLMEWISEYYIAARGEVIRAMIPSVLNKETKLTIQKVPDQQTDLSRLSEKHRQILIAFQDRTTLSFEVLCKRLNIKGLRYEITRLEKLGLVRTHYILDDKTRKKTVKWIYLVKTPSAEDLSLLEKRAPKRLQALKQLIRAEGEIQRSELDVAYTVIRDLEDSGWIRTKEHETFRDAYEHIQLKKPKSVKLTEHQQAALDQMTGALKDSSFSPFLLHGVTASGKTQVYLEIVRQTLNLQKTALILIPEISLTPQAVQRYRSLFGKSVAVLHSRMSHGERFDSWRKLRQGHCQIALGPRSAIFAPLENLGVLIVDEEHDHSYKQNDPSPRYHARDLAVMRAKINQCVVILGSATPSLETYTNAERNKYRRCELPERIDRTPMPRVHLVDRNMIPDPYKKQILSPLLYQRIRDCHEQGEQTILLQNRRGYATYLRCRSCGYIESCPNCDITLTYHQTDYRLRCHLCGFQKPAPSSCTQCQGPNLRYRGAGTQKVQEEIQTNLPDIRLLRMDLDTTRSKHAHSHILSAFENREADILLGTQMVSKGHDFPSVSLVGIVSADTGLLFPDFRAEEQTFQMLTQAAGRAGRRDNQGEVVIQTFYPEHPLFEFVLNQDYRAFYDYAISQRKILNYPPYGRLIVIRFKSSDPIQIRQAARAFIKSLPKQNQYEVLGPVASPISKKKGQFRFQAVLRSSKKVDPTGQILRKAIQTAMKSYTDAYRFPKVKMSVDVDPMDML